MCARASAVASARPHASAPGDVAPSAPPLAPRRAIATSYAGVRVVDPYRYLEDARDAATQRFVRDRAGYARALLARLDPTRSALRHRIGVLEHATTSIAALVRAGDEFFYLRHGPADHGEVLAERDTNGANDRVVLDPRAGASALATIGTFLPSNDGRFVAYSIADGDPGGAELHVLDTATLTDLTERIAGTSTIGATAWCDDGHSFVYDRDPPLLERHDPREERRRPIAYRHLLGRTPQQDTPVFGIGLDPAIPFGVDDVPIVRLSAASTYAVGLIRHGASRDLTVYVAPAAALATSVVPWRRVADLADGVVDVAFSSTTLFLLDHANGAGYEVRAVPLAAGSATLATTIVPASPDVIDGLAVASDGLYLRMRRGAVGELERIPLGVDGIYRGTAQTLTLPIAGVVAGLAAEPRASGVVAALASWSQPTRAFAFAPEESPVDLHLGGPADAPGALGRVADEELARSADGTLVPISIVHAVNVPHDGRRPALLETFAAYGRTSLPHDDPARDAWLERGGVYAVCHARGGGWNGDAWHRAATFDRKSRSSDDVIACAEHLVRRGYTTPARLVGLAAGAGGLALGGAVVRRPDLFAAAIEIAAISDPLRGQFSATGPADAFEFGSSETTAGASALLAISPYAHVSDLTTYPALFVVAGAGENGVAPWQAYKFAARIEVAQAAARPTIVPASEDESDLASDYEAFGLWQTGDTGFGFVPMNVPGAVGTPDGRAKRALSR